MANPPADATMPPETPAGNGEEETLTPNQRKYRPGAILLCKELEEASDFDWPTFLLSFFSHVVADMPASCIEKLERLAGPVFMSCLSYHLQTLCDPDKIALVRYHVERAKCPVPDELHEQEKILDPTLTAAAFRQKHREILGIKDVSLAKDHTPKHMHQLFKRIKVIKEWNVKTDGSMLAELCVEYPDKLDHLNAQSDAGK